MTQSYPSNNILVPISVWMAPISTTSHTIVNKRISYDDNRLSIGNNRSLKSILSNPYRTRTLYVEVYSLLCYLLLYCWMTAQLQARAPKLGLCLSFWCHWYIWGSCVAWKPTAPTAIHNGPAKCLWKILHMKLLATRDGYIVTNRLKKLPLCLYGFWVQWLIYSYSALTILMLLT